MQWHLCPFNSTIRQPTPQTRDSNQEQCSPRSTSRSTEASVVEALTDREILLKKISAYQFAALDLQLFLNTHPNDKKVLEKMKEYRDKSLPYIEEYEKKLQYPVNIKQTNPKLAKIIITQYGGPLY